MPDKADQHDRAQRAELTRTAHKAAIRGVAERNEAAHLVAKGKRQLLDQRKAEIRRNADH